MKHIVYKTTNTVNGKFYIGKHSTENLDDGYLGSGIILLRAIKKHGKEKFKREVLFVFDDEASAYQCERRVIDEVGLDPRVCYNACKGGVGFWKGMAHSTESKAKISLSNSGKRRSDSTRAAISAARIGRRLSDEVRAKLSAINTGRRHSEETKSKISASNQGKMRSLEFRERASEIMKGKPSPKKGVACSDETKKKMSTSKTGVAISASHKEKIREATTGERNAGFGKVWITDGVSNSRVAPGDTIPDGWRRGRSLRPYQFKKGN